MHPNEAKAFLKSVEEWRRADFSVVPGEKAEFYAVNLEDPHRRVALYNGNQVRPVGFHWDWEVLDAAHADALRYPAQKDSDEQTSPDVAVSNAPLI